MKRRKRRHVKKPRELAALDDLELVAFIRGKRAEAVASMRRAVKASESYEAFVFELMRRWQLKPWVRTEEGER